MANWYDFSNQANWGNAATATYDPMKNRTYGSADEAAQNGWDATALWQYGKDPMLQQRAALLNQTWGAQAAGNNPAQLAQDTMQTALTSGTAIGGGPNLGTSLAGTPVGAMTGQQAQTAMYGGMAPGESYPPKETGGPMQPYVPGYPPKETGGPMQPYVPGGPGMDGLGLFMGTGGPSQFYNPTNPDGTPIRGTGGNMPTTGGAKPGMNLPGFSSMPGGGMPNIGQYYNPGQFGGMTGQLDVSQPWNPLAVGMSTGAGQNPLASGRFGMDNPNVQAQADAITNQVSNNFNRNIAPGLRYAAGSAGQTGGSRQGVLEANALRDMNQTLGNSLAGLYGNAYQFDVNSAMQNQGMQNQLGLGLGNLALGQNSANQGFYGQQRGQDMQQVQLGANLLGQSNQGLAGIGSGLYGIGTQYQNAPWNTINQAVSGYSPFTGLGGTTTQGQNTGGGIQGLLGGLLGGAQLGRNMGWY